MFDTNFKNTYIDCLNRNRDFYLMFKDSSSGESNDMALTMSTLAPQFSVSVFNFDASEEMITAVGVIEQLVDRVKNIVGASGLDSEKAYSELEKAHLASEILGDSMIIIQNAEKLPKNTLSDLQRLSDEVRAKNDVARLRVLAIGDVGLMHLALAEHLKFINLSEI